MQIFRNEITRPAVQIREIATPAARDQNLPSHLPVMFQQQNPPPTLPRNCGAH
jgi:hypothetical protein